MFPRVFVILLSLIAASLPVASALAAKCDEAVRTGLSQLGADTSVGLAVEPSVAAGQAFTLNWRRGPMRGRYPVYLMIAFDGPVRFAGKGFYALLPTAEAAFGISKFVDKTRAVIPYYALGAPLQGEISVRPLRAGSLKVEWAVVGHDRCRELLAEGGQGSASIRVEATGAPEIVVNDSFAGQQPKQRIFSPAGGRVIEIFDGRYRLIDEAGRAELAERAGRTPRFSPTGRYLAAYVEDGIEIIDTVDGKTVHKDSPAYELAWDNADSFAILGQGGWARLAILAPSLAKPLLVPNPDGGYGCHACGATESVALRIDLENNVAVIKGEGSDGRAISLTVEADSWNANQPAEAFVQRQSQVAAFKLPKRWDLRGGLKFSHLGFYEADAQERLGQKPDAFQSALSKFLAQPLTQPIRATEEARSDAVKVAQWRGLSSVGEPAANGTMLKRLEEFGLPIPVGARDAGKAHFARQVIMLGDDHEGGLPRPDIEAKMTATARRIEQEVPAARGIFVAPSQEGGMCGPFEANRIYDRFQRAFRFQRGNRIIWITHQQCREGSAAFSYPTLVIFDSESSTPRFLAGGWSWSAETTSDPDAGDYAQSAEGFCFVNIADCDFDAQIFGGRYLLLSSAKSRAIEIYDLEERRNVFKKYNLPRGDLLQNALLSPDGTLVIQINADGSFAGYRVPWQRRAADIVVPSAEQLFEGRYVDDEVVVWTPEGRFDATAEGAHYVSLRLPGRVGTHTFEQFSARLKTPGLVAKLLAGASFPETRLVSPPSLSGTLQAKDGRAAGTAMATGDTPLASLLVFQDGLLTDRLEAKGGTSWKFELDLLKGTRWVSLVAVDQAGLASLPMGRDLPPSRSAPRRVHVLAIGVDDYADPRIADLGLARSDAKRFAEAVGAIGGDIVVASRRVLHEKDASREGVLAALRQVIAAAGPGETAMLFFAGHGVRSDDGAYFLATPDTRLDDIAGTSLPWSDVASVLSGSRGRIAVFLDTCHSGAAGTGAFTTNDAAAQSLLERIPSGIVVFSASKGRELSEESPAVGGGVFTSALVNVIAGNRARFDTNGNGAIEISELYRGVKGQVTTGTNGRQTPWLARNQMVGDFALF